MTTEAHRENHSDDQVGPGGRDRLPLAGRTVLVTGVSRRVGIGHAIACRAADYGASIVAHHYRPHDVSQPWGADDVEAVMDSIRSHLVGPAQLIDVPADLAAPGEPTRVVEQAAAAAGHLDALVCNQAMSSPDGPLSEMTEAVLDAHWTVDARASILLAQAFAAQEVFAAPAPPGPGRRRGAIVFLTSGQGLGPLPGEIAYAAAKAAIAGVTLTISEELIDAGITVNTVNPGPVDTGYVTEEIRQATAAMFPQGRWGEPDDAARLITWLLTDEARWITGQVISSEGGFARWRR
ncbi:SDR family oxidoreductase [Actinomyces naeslundii]|uniref:SDR family oxidoreductase n=2 Tax=Actinomyces naeslundii TaxID=1655 RepID=A0AA47FII8_ACTNA|nr:SDR family oxidoreductase [Actinomyces naeslundii]OMG18544.1 3-ketoacyl-ACP reductase [Actinomyces naeslundii]PKY96189.1 3-ketoacyl-ACP reductase [Actinomyces naeslundii]WAL43974.1 SDR family oxidoreductase [Actinomyces naeslundii]